MTNETKPATRYECPDCDWTGTMDTINGLHHLHHIHERIAAGELVPAGACPDCGALIDVEDADVPASTLTTCAFIMRARGWTVVERGSGVLAMADGEPWDTYGTGIKPYSQRVTANQTLEVLIDAMQEELNEMRAKFGRRL